MRNTAAIRARLQVELQREATGFGKPHQVLFWHIGQWSDQGDAPVKETYLCPHGLQPSVVQQIQQRGLSYVVGTMSKRHLASSQAACGQERSLPPLPRAPEAPWWLRAAICAARETRLLNAVLYALHPEELLQIPVLLAAPQFGSPTTPAATRS